MDARNLLSKWLDIHMKKKRTLTLIIHTHSKWVIDLNIKGFKIIKIKEEKWNI